MCVTTSARRRVDELVQQIFSENSGVADRLSGDYPTMLWELIDILAQTAAQYGDEYAARHDALKALLTTRH